MLCRRLESLIALKLRFDSDVALRESPQRKQLPPKVLVLGFEVTAQRRFEDAVKENVVQKRIQSALQFVDLAASQSPPPPMMVRFGFL